MGSKANIRHTTRSKNKPYLSFATHTHKRQDHRDEGHNQQQRESGAITQKVGRTIHWETRDTRGKGGGNIITVHGAYILTRSPSLSV